ncbi:ABC transporter substrate-binding protein (plasmid) [Paenibacillus cellulosilyticus]|nr:ABC transporter substrate-binding protein [Paenibacillus cellulosilyticus]QKS43300.1 ABC transporter substrate-binding protein [Paenibacillus cellulosilyticus]
MSKKWSTAIIFVLLTALITACGSSSDKTTPSDNSGQQTETSAPKDGGNLIIGVGADPVILNPNYAGDRVSLTIDQSLYAPLFQVNNGKITYYLADSLTASEDSMTYTLKLKSGLTWHDGQPLTADDVVFTINSILDEKQNSMFRGNLIIGGKPIEVSKVDDLTVAFKMPQAAPAFEATLVQLTPIPKHIFENEADIEKSTKNNTPVGSGPFKFKEYKTGEYVTLERFDNYFGGKPHLDTVTYRIAKDTNAANLALQNGELNINYVSPQDAPTIEGTGNYDLMPYSEGRLSYILINENSDLGVLNKKEVRQALGYALNRDELITAAYLSSEYADAAHSFLTPDTLFHTNDVATFDNDPAKAKELLQQAGVTNLKLRFVVKSGDKTQEAIALYVQQKLKDIGVTVEVQSIDASALNSKVYSSNATDFDLSVAGYIMGFDPDAYSILFTTDNSSNYSHYSNKQVDELFQKGAGESDATKRGELYTEAQKLVAEDAAIYPIAYTKTIVAVDKRFGGIDEAVLKPVVIFEDLSKLYMK